MPLRTLVVDDEQLAREELCFLLESVPDVELVGQATNGLEAVQMAESLSPDLLLLDIQMPGLDGFQVVRELMAGSHIPQFIFVTAYDQYAIKAFEVNAVDYLLKPVEKQRLEEALSRASSRGSTEGDGEEAPIRGRLEQLLGALESHQSLRRLVVKSGDRFLLVDAADVVYATVEDGVVSVATDQVIGTSNARTLDELSTSLDPNVFWRVHRSFVVNLDRIKEVVPWFNRTIQLKMADPAGTEIPVSRTQTRRLKEHLGL